MPNHLIHYAVRYPKYFAIQLDLGVVLTHFNDSAINDIAIVVNPYNIVVVQ